MYPHERSLVEKHGDRFAIVGVNSDPREKLVELESDGTVLWDSFWDGGNTRGPIATRWNVRAWPTLYLLDRKGFIRFINVRGEELERAIESLLAEGDGERGAAD